MNKDARLYGRFTLDFADSPKIAPLSDLAFRTLVEMTLHSRRMLEDGFVDERIAHRKWKKRALDELCSNDPEKPSLLKVSGGFRIHDFENHQQTRSDIERKRSAGSLGGKASAQARATADAQPLSKLTTETETESETATSKEVAKRATRVPLDLSLTDEMRAWGATQTPLIDLDQKLGEFIDYWTTVPGAKGLKVDWIAAWRNGMRTQQRWAVEAGVKPPVKVKSSAEVAERRRVAAGG